MTKQRLIERIAREDLLIETLDERGRDHLDFHDVSVRGVKDALERAYAEGYAAGLKRAASQHATSS